MTKKQRGGGRGVVGDNKERRNTPLCLYKTYIVQGKQWKIYDD